MKLTEQHIQFAEVAFPPHISPLCRSFIQQVLRGLDGWLGWAAVGGGGLGLPV